jgi:DNA invertase Pin-like site-specific DNA recombinase
MSRPAGIQTGRPPTRGREAKLKAVRKVLRLLKDGYPLNKAAKLAGASRNHIKLWAADLGIAWPSKGGSRHD